MESLSSLIHQSKNRIFPINRQLLKLKLCYFLLYSAMFSVLPYINIISTQLVDYHQLTIVFACVTVTSLLTPVVTGFVADKLGIYKAIIITAGLLMGVVHLPMLWLYSLVRTSHAAGADRNESIHVNSSAGDLPSISNPALPSVYIFPMLILIRILGFLTFDMALPLLDATGLAMSRKHSGDFGQQKLWATISMIVIPPLCGFLVDTISESLGIVDYSIAFYISAAVAITSVPLCYSMEIEVQRNEHSTLATAKKVIAMIDVDVFLLVQILVGGCLGFHFSFLSVYVDAELIASKTLYGLAFACSGISSTISLSFAKPIIDRFGEPNTMAFSLMLYACRFIILCFLRNPWMLILTESLDGFSGCLGCVAGNYFCAKAAPPGMLASMNGILGTVTYGIGRNLGGAVGSLIIAMYGLRSTYLLLGILAGSTAILYMMLYHLMLKKTERKRLALSNTIPEAVPPVIEKPDEDSAADIQAIRL